MISKKVSATPIITMVLIGLLGGQFSVRANALSSFERQLVSSETNQSDSPKKAIVGSWVETVTFTGEGTPPPFKSLNTFNADGGLTVSDQGNVNLAEGLVFGAGHGSWIAVGSNTFDWTVVELICDPNGHLIGILKVRGRYTVDQSGNSYNGNFKAEASDTDGNQLFVFEGTNEGHRIQVDPLL